VALRATFLIDKKGIVRQQTVNDLPLGRNIDEMLRLVDALAFHEKHGDVCPANWTEGKKTMRADQQGLKEYFGS
jgi:alkyl hydroperoxide reductase subunit AhpC